MLYTLTNKSVLYKSSFAIILLTVFFVFKPNIAQSAAVSRTFEVTATVVQSLTMEEEVSLSFGIIQVNKLIKGGVIFLNHEGVISVGSSGALSFGGQRVGKIKLTGTPGLQVYISVSNPDFTNDKGVSMKGTIVTGRLNYTIGQNSQETITTFGTIEVHQGLTTGRYTTTYIVNAIF
jgi:hypothetical protein